MLKDIQCGVVVKSNKLIEASYRLGVNEQRILLAAISQIGINEAATDAKTYKVILNDIVSLTETKSKDLYRQLYEAAKSLRKRDVKFIGYDGKFIETSWVQSVEYDPDNKTELEIRFSNRVLPYLTNLSREFTRYNLNEVAKLTSIYAHRFYELLMQWNAKGSRVIEIDWLRDVFMLENKYRQYKDLKSRVIQPALEQINKHTTLNVSYEPVKTGRKITHLDFIFEPSLRKSKVMPNQDAKDRNVSNNNIQIKDSGNEEHKGIYHPFSKMEIMLAQIVGESDLETRNRLLAERDLLPS